MRKRGITGSPDIEERLRGANVCIARAQRMSNYDQANGGSELEFVLSYPAVPGSLA